MIKLSAPMRKALKFYSEDHTAEAVAYPVIGTRVALILRPIEDKPVSHWRYAGTKIDW